MDVFRHPVVDVAAGWTQRWSSVVRVSDPQLRVIVTGQQIDVGVAASALTGSGVAAMRDGIVGERSWLASNGEPSGSPCELIVWTDADGGIGSNVGFLYGDTAATHDKLLAEALAYLDGLNLGDDQISS